MKFLLLIIFSFYSINSTSQDLVEKDLDLDLVNVKGKVKTIIETLNDTLRKKKRIFKYYFDQNTCLIEKTDHFFDGESLIKRKVFIYDNNKNILEVKSAYSSDTLSLAARYVYDKNNHLTSIDFNDNKVEYIYDKNNFLNEEIYKYPNGKIHDHNFYEKTSTGVIKYNNLYYDKQKIKGITVLYIFTEENKISEFKLFPINSESEKTKKYFKYDDNGNIIECNPFSNKSIIKNDYVYDGIGNWIKKTVFKDGKIINIYDRTIEYY